MKKKNKIIFIIILVFFLLNHKTLISEYNNFLGKKYFLDGEYELSQKYFSKNKDDFSIYNLANSFYKNGNFSESIEKYLSIESTEKEDLKFKIFHNLGNSFYRQAEKNNFEKEYLLNSVDNYKKALEIKEDKETRFNLEFVLEKIQDLSEENKQEEQENGNQGENENNSNDENNNGESTENNEENINSETEENLSNNGEKFNETEKNNSNLSEEDREFLEQYQDQLKQEQIKYGDDFNKNYNEKNNIFDDFFSDNFFDNSILNDDSKKDW